MTRARARKATVKAQIAAWTGCFFYDYGERVPPTREAGRPPGLLKSSRDDSTSARDARAPQRRSHSPRILVQVKGGGILITLEKPTKPVREEAADAGRYTSLLWHDKDYPKIQILTIEGLLSGKERVEAPPQMNPFAKAQHEGKGEKQSELI